MDGNRRCRSNLAAPDRLDQSERLRFRRCAKLVLEQIDALLRAAERRLPPPVPRREPQHHALPILARGLNSCEPLGRCDSCIPIMALVGVAGQRFENARGSLREQRALAPAPAVELLHVDRQIDKKLAAKECSGPLEIAILR
jgi:hypothetical protein